MRGFICCSVSNAAQFASWCVLRGFRFSFDKAEFADLDPIWEYVFTFEGVTPEMRARIERWAINSGVQLRERDL